MHAQIAEHCLIDFISCQLELKCHKRRLYHLPVKIVVDRYPYMLKRLVESTSRVRCIPQVTGKCFRYVRQTVSKWSTTFLRVPLEHVTTTWQTIAEWSEATTNAPVKTIQQSLLLTRQINPGYRKKNQEEDVRHALKDDTFVMYWITCWIAHIRELLLSHPTYLI